MSVVGLHEYRPVTAEELWLVPENGMRLELVGGVVREMAPAGGEHGEIAFNLQLELGLYVRSQRLGRLVTAETGFLLARNPDTVRAPDCAFLSLERAPTPLSSKYVEITPDLVIEVVSPNDSAEEVSEKVGEWVRAGVRLVWVVYPRTRTIAVHRSAKEIRLLHEGEALTGGDVVPGFEMPVEDVFV